jgi:hypothetical protein
MKLKLSQLKPNPFKKEINGGKLNKEQVEKIKANIKQLGLMGSLPAFKKDGQFYLVNGHHRVQALKEVYGKDFEIDVDVKDYSEDQIFRGMVIENLTQRSGEYREEKDNIVAVRKYLAEYSEEFKKIRESNRGESPRLKGGEYLKAVTANDIAEWIDANTGKVIDKDEIIDLLNINDHLAPELEKTVVKKHDKTKEIRDDESLNYTQAIILSRIEDKKEQKDLAIALKKTPEQRVREQTKLITQYKDASEETKQKVREGELDLKDVLIENIKDNLKKKIEERKEENKGKVMVTHYRQVEKEIKSKTTDTNDRILKTCLFLNSLEKSGVLHELDLKMMLEFLESGANHGRGYTKVMELLIKSQT